jgi:two-component system sensor histidine kinase KdpD
MRAALLAAVSHDLRSPLAAAEESLDLLSRLATSLLDVARLQAGARSVFPLAAA